MEGTLSELWLAGPFNLTLEALLAELGEPSIATTSVSNYGESIYLEGYLDLHYPQLGHLFVAMFWGKPNEQGALDACLQTDDVIYHVFVFPPSPIDEYMKRDRNLAENRVDIVDEWPGYTCIEMQW